MKIILFIIIFYLIFLTYLSYKRGYIKENYDKKPSVHLYYKLHFVNKKGDYFKSCDNYVLVNIEGEYTKIPKHKVKVYSLDLNMNPVIRFKVDTLNKDTHIPKTFNEVVIIT